MKIYVSENFAKIKKELTEDLLCAPVIHRDKWQQLDVAESPLHATHELSNVIIHMRENTPYMTRLQVKIKPDLPWAEDHFKERIGGKPINPGKAHAYWPYHGQSMQATLRGMGERNEHYDHNYMERMWCGSIPHFTGYRFEPGDLGDVIKLLKEEPNTRQAYLPIWFPEDTGVTEHQRVPCSLGYQFIKGPDDTLNLAYFLRACELYRHFTNDVYLAIRLQQYVAKQVNQYMGSFTMHIVNMHLFVGDESHVKSWR